MSEVFDTNGRHTDARVEYGNDNIISPRHPLSGESWEVVAAALGKTLPPISLGEAAHDAPMGFDDDMERHILTIDWSLPGHNLHFRL